MPSLGLELHFLQIVTAASELLKPFDARLMRCWFSLHLPRTRRLHPDESVPQSSHRSTLLDNRGHLYLIEEEENRIDRIDPSDGTISVVAGYGPGRKAGKRLHTSG
jgi:hypothetical protein